MVRGRYSSLFHYELWASSVSIAQSIGLQVANIHLNLEGYFGMIQFHMAYSRE